MWGARKEWYVSRGETQHGPFSESEFRKLARSGSITANDLVWHSGLTDWIEYKSLKTYSNRSAIYLLRQILHAPRSLASTALDVCIRPADFGRERIDKQPNSLRRACSFYLNVFAIAFLLHTLTSITVTGASHP